MTNTEREPESLLNQALEITMLGVLLTGIIALIEHRLTGQGVLVICSFLASTFVWKLIWPLEHLRRYRWWQLFSIVMMGLFSWWLIYQAENTRAGWYRFNVLQKRIDNLVRTAPAYVIAADDDGYITSSSENIYLLTGYTSQELYGQQLSVLMRDGPAAKDAIAYQKAMDVLRKPDTDSGWMLQGLIVIGVKHKDGHIVPVKAYVGAIRWSANIQFKGDIDTFAVMVPASIEEASGRNSTVRPMESQKLKIAPSPPPIPTFSPVMTPVPVPHPPAKSEY